MCGQGGPALMRGAPPTAPSAVTPVTNWPNGMEIKASVDSADWLKLAGIKSETNGTGTKWHEGRRVPRAAGAPSSVQRSPKSSHPMAGGRRETGSR